MLLLLLLLTLPAVVQAQFTYTINNGTITITGYTGPGGAVTIPDTINGLPVTSIGANAFDYCRSLTSVTIPSSVTNVGDAAFFECTSLTAITVQASNPAYSSADGVLFDKNQTALIQYPVGKAGSQYTIPNSVTTIGYQAFAGCTRLASITIPNSVTSIGNSAFRFCYGLTSVTIPDSVTSIGDWAFSDCTSLTSVTMPTSVTEIADSAFEGCTSLTNVTIPNSVTRIGEGAFSGCTSLTNATMPNSVTEIAGSAFDGCTSLTNVTIPYSVTSIGNEAFGNCSSLTAIMVDALNSAFSSLEGVLFRNNQTALIRCPGGKSGTYTIPESVTCIGIWAFENSTRLTGVTIGNSVTNIGIAAFCICTSLTSVTIPNSVTSIGDWAFSDCTNLTAAYFKGNAPSVGSYVFYADSNVTVYYLPGTTGWGPTFAGRPTVVWNLPAIQTAPQTQTAEAGSAVGLRVKASGSSPLFWLWYLNYTNLISWGTNSELELTNVQFAQAGAYSVVVSNALGAVTSSPAMLNVIAAVEHRPVPGVQVTGETASLLNVDYADSLSATPLWTTLGLVSLSSTSQYCFDLTLPLPAQRFYRAWQTGAPGVMPFLDLHLVPAITLTGDIGHALRLDYINQFGATDAWVTLDTVTLTNTSQLYFDVSAPGQPQRLYRLVP